MARSALVASPAVPAGQVHGVVVDAYSGRPVPGAMAYALGYPGVYADSLGRFRLTGVTLPTKLGAGRIDYPSFSLDLPADSTTGWAAVLALGPQLCEGPNPYGVDLEIRDAATGLAPTGEVSAVGLQDSLVVSETRAAEADDEYLLLPVTLGGGYGPTLRSASPISVRIESARYATWSQDGIRLTPNYCGGAGVTIPVWLLPTRAAKDGVPSNKR